MRWWCVVGLEKLGVSEPDLLGIFFGLGKSVSIKDSASLGAVVQQID